MWQPSPGSRSCCCRLASTSWATGSATSWTRDCAANGHDAMLTFLLRRCLQTVPVIIGVTIATFLLAQIIPGDPVDVMLGPSASEEARPHLSEALGLQRPFLVQYLSYVGHLLQGDLGQSYSFGRPVAQILAERI